MRQRRGACRPSCDGLRCGGPAATHWRLTVRTAECRHGRTKQADQAWIGRPRYHLIFSALARSVSDSAPALSAAKNAQLSALVMALADGKLAALGPIPYQE